MSLLKEVSGNIVGASRFGTFPVLTVSEQVFTQQRALAQDLPLAGSIPTSNVVSCVFAFPPGLPVLDSSAPSFVDDLIKYTNYSYPGQTPWGIHFIDTAIHQEADGKYYQYQMRVTQFSQTAGNFYFLGTAPVADGYWAISGVDLFYSGSSVPTLVGPPGPGQELFALVDTVTPPVVNAAAPWFQFYPNAATPAIDSRRCYYLKYGVPSATAGTSPAYAGAPYPAKDLYSEDTTIRKVIEVYGTDGQTTPADVGFYTYDAGNGVRQFKYVAVSEQGVPVSGDWVPAPPRVYRLDTSAVPSLSALEGTYWGVEGIQGKGEQLFNGYLVDKLTGALLTLEPVSTSVSAAGFIENKTGVATEGAMFPSKYGIVFGPDAATGWQVYYPASLLAGFDNVINP